MALLLTAVGDSGKRRSSCCSRGRAVAIDEQSQTSKRCPCAPGSPADDTPPPAPLHPPRMGASGNAARRTLSEPAKVCVCPLREVAPRRCLLVAIKNQRPANVSQGRPCSLQLSAARSTLSPSPCLSLSAAPVWLAWFLVPSRGYADSKLLGVCLLSCFEPLCSAAVGYYNLP